MPMLEITPEMVGPNRTRLALGYIESVMFWPLDAEQRAEADKTTTATWLKDTMNDVPSAKRAALAAEWMDWAGLLADAVPLRKLQPETAKPFSYGMMAGRVVNTMTYYAARGEPAKLTAAKQEAVDAFRRIGSSNRFLASSSAKHRQHLAVTVSTFDNVIWPRYRPVAHLWAAYTNSALLLRNATFPCTLGALPQFLAVAQVYADEGMALTLSRRRGETLLRADELWHIPPGLSLPRLTLAYDDCSKLP